MAKNRAKWAGPPTQKRARKPAVPAAAASKPEEAKPELPDTREAVLTALSELCDKVDEIMSKPHGDVEFQRWVAREPWSTFDDDRRKLKNRLNAFLDLQNVDDLDDVVIRRAVGARPGDVPSWARPGEFLVWCGTVPVICEWGGYPIPGARFLPAEPKGLWLSRAGNETTDGEWFLRYSPVKSTWDNVLEMFRAGLRDRTLDVDWVKNKRVPTFGLAPLDQGAREAATWRLEQWPWLRDSLKRGPVDPVPMPPHIRAVQHSL